MCGICGIIGRPDREALDRMVDILSHRGPDDRGTVIDEPRGIALGHRRLSILDLSTAGHQPMISQSGRLTLVFNGEIYNFRELREGLEAKGYRFRTRTDTEVILALYEDVGYEAFGRLNGMFALAIWDREADAVVLARDHFGIKPLYYQVVQGVLGFASEAKALFQVPGFEPRLNEEALPLYLQFLWTPDPVTAFAGVLKLPASHYAVWKGGELTLHRYWDLTFPEADADYPTRSPASLAREFRERFTTTVKSQLVSDVPLGAFLSAGLDSTSIVAAMQQGQTQPVRTYTIAFAPSHRAGELTMDDPAVAARTAAQYGCRHEEIVVDPDVASLLPRLTWHMDEPTSDPAVIMSYLVSRAARKDVTVLLSGVGGDEVLGGYRKYVAALDARKYTQVPLWLRQSVLDPLFRHVPATPGRPWSGVGRLVRKWGRSASLSPRAQFIANGTYLDSVERGALLSTELAHLASVDTDRYHEAAFDRVSGADWLHQMLYNDSRIFMPSLNLTYNDKMSMASSVEVRVPFLDWELAQWVASAVPPPLKIRGRQTKWLLREAFRDRLPAEVLRQRKAGFGAPIGRWLTRDLREMVDDLLAPERVRRRGIFSEDAVAGVVREQREGRVERSMHVWQLLTFELWMQAFLDNGTRSTH